MKTNQWIFSMIACLFLALALRTRMAETDVGFFQSFPISCVIDYMKHDNNINSNYECEVIKVYNETIIPKYNNTALFYGAGMLGLKVHDKFNPGCVYHTDLVHFHTKIVCFHQFYVSGACSLNNLTHRVKLVARSGIDLYWNFPGPVLGNYNHVVAFGHYNLQCYGHFFLDVILPCILLPQDIIKKSYIIYRDNATYALQFLEAMGFGDRVITLGIKEWVYADHVYTMIEPRTSGNIASSPLYNLSIYLRHKFNAEDIVPTDICYMLRKTRIIHNLKDAIEEASKQLNIEIKLIPDYIETAHETVKIWAKIKIVVGTTGSNLMKCIFMKEKTCVIHLMANIFNDCIVLSTASCYVYQVCIHVNMGFWEGGGNVDVNLLIKALKIAISLEESGKWPQIEGEEYKFLA
ncbi:hypothetical protein TVAG_376750 [Trichomonas vaginalis G3]|uniref:Glycosyltransferase 61 catalytic domain-containing protein n=1 Tax=Trichomonas vaginalis (strain ATCC PRA-98 / G3) TaxID=412133 RepID=A2FW20_TRIV3|nr:glycosyltransferase family [Trichomonas vaginalis G3]EAX90891.1 hypothetical protein TVAG_376750 [Trichomonas vaginalis G3]KAI5504021.1 glycosyltransferase family [Trichomonas vaginalis G3]|eukprot:XP_001303821.1 hypothetical protein [Trichomonas vaginalis G3]